MHSDAPRGPVPGRRRPSPASIASLAVVVLLLLAALVVPDLFGAAVDSVFGWSTRWLGGALLIGPLLLLVFIVVLACTRFGRVRLGRDDERPEFSTAAWVAMLLSASVGVGVVSYGVSEPLTHFLAPPLETVGAETREAAVLGLRATFFEWGVMGWGIFGAVGLAIGYTTHRLGRDARISTALRPLLGRHHRGWAGQAVDAIAIVATLFGSATSLGLGAIQFNSGMQSLWGVASGPWVQGAIIVAFTALFTLSAVTGVARGVRWLSNVAMVIAGALLVFVAAVGPFAETMGLVARAFGDFLVTLVPMSFASYAGGYDQEWLAAWPYFMMAWWIGWGAFVGVFLARISRGRSIRQVVAGVVVVPGLVFCLWFGVLGANGVLMHGASPEFAAAAAGDAQSATFALLEQFPLGAVTIPVTMFLVALFFISGADANTHVLAMLAGGSPERPRPGGLIVWGAATGAIALALLVIGGLGMLQMFVIVLALPFLVIIGALAVALVRQLRADAREEGPGPAALAATGARDAEG